MAVQGILIMFLDGVIAQVDGTGVKKKKKMGSIMGTRFYAKDFNTGYVN